MWRYVRTDELYHYGTVGMRWGTRRTMNSYSKATDDSSKKKAEIKMDKQINKASNKLEKLDSKANKKLNSSVKKRYGFTGSPKKYEKAKLKADKKAYKARNWYLSMQKTFGNQKISDIPKKDISIGEKYVKYFRQNSEISY